MLAATGVAAVLVLLVGMLTPFTRSLTRNGDARNGKELMVGCRKQRYFLTKLHNDSSGTPLVLLLLENRR